MATKLTLRIDEELIARAKTYAKQSGKSVSRLVADFFALLSQSEEEQSQKIAPKVKSLHGLLRDVTIDFDDYKRYIEQKYL